jgi:pimeloyl-ACP methyl ester carboxylesterase
VRTLEALGIEKAVFMGHSMGGRMIIQLATIAPERVLAAVLLDAAAGAAHQTHGGAMALVESVGFSVVGAGR